jgi:peptide/nickel transport system permease protein
MSATRTLGLVILATLAAIALAAGVLSANPPERQFPTHVYAPPMIPRVIDAGGNLRAPFVYPLRVEDRLARTFTADRSRPLPLRFFAGGALVGVDPAEAQPWFPLGTDGLGRDVLARLAAGARTSLGVAALAALGALLIGAGIGATAGSTGGAVDLILMRVADFVLALPVLYLVMALRAAAPLVLEPLQVFWILVAVFALAAWPMPARGVRAIVVVERSREYAEAARSIGSSTARLLLRHLLPATRGFLATQAALLVPGFIVAEATLSFVGLGFSEPIASWGAMLHEAGRGRTVAEAPWLLSPALAIALVVLAVNLVASGDTRQHPSLIVRRKYRD